VEELEEVTRRVVNPEEDLGKRCLQYWEEQLWVVG
jgi:hypothetical protein